MDGRRPGRREATGEQNPAYSPTRLPSYVYAGQKLLSYRGQIGGVESGSNLHAESWMASSEGKR
ncbi:hypothetical protein GCM10010360_71010 [Streptomyces nogalater]